MKTVWSEWQGTSRKRKAKRQVSKDMVCIKGTAETERKSQSLQNETEGCGQDRKGDLNVCDHLMKWYGDKYDFAEAEVKYNTFNGRFYIYGRMWLRKGTAHDKGKK